MNTNLIPPQPPSALELVARGEDALDRLRAQMNAIADGDLSPMNFDPNVAIARALGAAPAIAALRTRIASDCPGCDLHAIDELEDRAYATSAAHAMYSASVKPPREFEELVEEVLSAREVLLNASRTLVSLEVYSQVQLDGLKGGNGYRDAAEDVLTLVALAKSHWEQVKGYVPFVIDQLPRVQAAAEGLLRQIGLREQNPERTLESGRIRARAFTLLDRAYDQARRAVIFLRWEEDDADTIAPPLRTKPGNRRTAAEKATDGTTKVGGNGAGNGTGNGAGNGASNSGGNGTGTTTTGNAKPPAIDPKTLLPKGFAPKYPNGQPATMPFSEE